jgi:phage terminase large subunit-like protein
MTAAALQLAALPEADRRRVLVGLSEDELAALEYEWRFWARPDQLPPEGYWRTWLLLGGRGSGKTRSAAEWCRAEVESGRRLQLGIVGPTADALRRVQIEGPSGLLATAPPWFRPTYEPSRRIVTWPNGAVAHLFSAEEPDRLRGPNLDGAWCDEVTSWANAADVWDMLQMCLRIPGPQGHAPQVLVSTTPKPTPILKAIIAAETTAITRARTPDNAGNLDASTLQYLMNRYGGTTLGRQELDAELLDDVDGALWHRALLDQCRRYSAPMDLRRVVVAIDPAGGTGRGSTETGIIVAGVARDGHAYMLADLSGKYSPEQWARRAVAAYHTHRADRIIAEKNFGGDMVTGTPRAVDATVPVKMVQASRGKAVRAEPVVALYEQHLVHHIGTFTGLEDQLCQWDPNGNDPSPDRLDALVWAITELVVEKQAAPARWVAMNWIAR